MAEPGPNSQFQALEIRMKRAEHWLNVVLCLVSPKCLSALLLLRPKSIHAASPETLRVRELIVVDDAGKERIVIAAPIPYPIVDGKTVKPSAQSRIYPGLLAKIEPLPCTSNAGEAARQGCKVTCAVGFGARQAGRERALRPRCITVGANWFHTVLSRGNIAAHNCLDLKRHTAPIDT
jgi:hypothetical protein